MDVSNMELSGKIRYVLGAKSGSPVLRGLKDAVTFVPYDHDVLPEFGVGVGYCNLLDERESYKFSEDGGRGDYGPYLTPSETSREYEEGRIDPNGKGWGKNLLEQFNRRLSAGFRYIELDNWDSYDVDEIISAIELAEKMGLKVVGKNPRLLTEKGLFASRILAHRNVSGCVVEEGAGRPVQMVDMRRAAGRSDNFFIWFVSFGPSTSWAEGISREIKTLAIVGMSVTHDLASKEYGGDVVDVLLPVVPSQEKQQMPTTRPAHMITADSLKGRIVDGPQIPQLAMEIASSFPKMTAYAKTAKSTTAWCGIFVAIVLLRTYRVEPPFHPDDVQELLRWMWVDSFEDQPWGAEQVSKDDPHIGDIIIMKSPHHITFFDGWVDDGRSRFWGLGGNQSDGVTRDDFAASGIRTVRRSPTEATIISVDPNAQPLLKVDVINPVYNKEAQGLLGLPQTGVFDGMMHDVVMAFQASRGLSMIDGEIGDETWPVLRSKKPALPVPGIRDEVLTSELGSRIDALVMASSIAHYTWKNAVTGEPQGKAPLGYTKGMARVHAKNYLDLAIGGSAAAVMAMANTDDDDHDALSWYDPEFRALGMSNAIAGTGPLRHLHMLQLGLGMRESSGRYCEGRDRSVPMSDQTSDTAEAGLFQQSYNSHVASPELDKLFHKYSTDLSDGMLQVFKEGVTPKDSDFETVTSPGSNNGSLYQRLAKSKPLFAVEFAAVGLRTIGGQSPHGHWGPIRRKEAEIRPEADDLFKQVELLVDASLSARRPKEPDILVPPVKGPDMTTTNEAVERALAKIRPILGELISSGQMSDEMRKWMDDTIVRFGGKVPQRILLPGSSSPIPDTSSPAADTSSAPPIKGPLDDVPNTLINLSAGAASLIGSIAATQAGFQGDAFAGEASTMTSLLTTFGLPFISALGIPAPLAKVGASLLSRGINALRRVVGVSETPKTT